MKVRKKLLKVILDLLHFLKSEQPYKQH